MANHTRIAVWQDFVLLWHVAVPLTGDELRDKETAARAIRKEKGSDPRNLYRSHVTNHGTATYSEGMGK